jgi:exopolysaccharide production protein ExoZ
MRADVRLPTIHAARAFAAMAVLIFHVTVQNGFLGNFLFSGGHGVDLFFIISGFVMVYAHDGERGLRAAWRFCRRRIIRIYPPYWIVMFGVWWAGLAHIDTSPISAFFLYNQGGPAIIQQAWTLSMEMAFYILFVAFFFVGKRGFAVLSAGWVALVAYNFLYPWYSGLLLTTRVTEFFMGALGAYIVCACRHVRISGVWVLVAGILTGATFYFDSYGRLPHYYDVWNYGATCTLLISAGALWDLSYRPRYPRWVMVLGDASYAIYLLHYVERDALTYVMQHYPVLSRWGQDLPVGVGIATIAFTGVLFHWWIERPTVRWLHARVG